VFLYSVNTVMERLHIDSDHTTAVAQYFY